MLFFGDDTLALPKVFDEERIDSNTVNTLKLVALFVKM